MDKYLLESRTIIYVYAYWQGLEELAKSVGLYFRLTSKEMNQITDEVTDTVKYWKAVAKQIGISRADRELMASAFIV